jgi:NADPH:quinone reductase-like Zn-dependent oxidoreductase
VVVQRAEVIPTPAHLSDEQIAAWPLAGLTAWRYFRHILKLLLLKH